MKKNDPISIALLDDDVNFNELIISKLSKISIDVTSYTTGESLFNDTNLSFYDIFFIDLSLSENPSAGFEVIRDLRSRLFEYIPIILISNDQDKDKIAHGIECGADDYITKPIDFKLLRVKLKQLVERFSTKKTELDKLVMVPETFRQASLNCTFTLSQISEHYIVLESSIYISKGTILNICGDFVEEYFNEDNLSLVVTQTKNEIGLFYLKLSWPLSSSFIPSLREKIMALKENE